MSHNPTIGGDQSPPEAVKQGEGQSSFSSVNLFISHKHQDIDAVTEMKRLLCRYGGSRLNVFVSEDISAGQDWRQWIEDKVGHTHILMFMYTDPNRDWDWCLFEIGKFSALSDRENRRIVCVHHPEIEPPKQIENLQTVPANPRQVKQLLQDFYGRCIFTGDSAPLNTVHANDGEEIERQANEIVNLFQPMKVREQFLPNRISVKIDDIASVCDPHNPNHYCRIPDSAPVSASDLTLHQVFGLNQGEFKWGDLRRRMELRGDSNWMQELGRAVVAAAKRETHDVPTRQTFRSVGGSAIYRPVLYRVDFRRSEESNQEEAVNFHILFTEEITPRKVAGPGPIGVLYNMLREGHRFFSEVIISYKGKVDEIVERQGREVLGPRLSEVINIIEQEAQELGLSEETMLETIKDEEGRQELQAMFTRWKDELRPRILEAAMRHDYCTVEQMLEDLALCNQAFMTIVSREYAERLKQ